MADTANPGRLSSLAELEAAWNSFRDGGTVACPRDAGAMALSVDAAASLYRLVCTDCGYSSPWFESGPNGIRARSGSVASAGSAALGDD